MKINVSEALLSNVDWTKPRWLYIKIFDQNGREIAEAWPEQELDAETGTVTLNFDAIDAPATL
jgi:hypothetical protein